METMKYLITALSLITLVAIIHTESAVCQTVPAAARLQQLESQLQSQLEKIKYARVVADRSTSLTKIRIARELRRSELEMERQIEILERLKEQMQDQTGDSPSSFSGIRNDWNKELQSTISGLAQQIQTAGTLLSRMESFREKVENSSEDNVPADPYLGDPVPSSPGSGGVTADALSVPPCAGRGTSTGTSSPSTCPFMR